MHTDYVWHIPAPVANKCVREAEVIEGVISIFAEEDFRRNEFFTENQLK